jgi:hypothetical protein
MAGVEAGVGMGIPPYESQKVGDKEKMPMEQDEWVE